MVDLGLPSGLKWADRNIGASSPEESGLYFQWGDTVGYTKEQVEAGEKIFDFYSYFDSINGSSERFEKYYCDEDGYTGPSILESADDAATVNMGSEYRMPTKADFKELIDNSTIIYIDLQGNEFTQDEVKSGSISENNLKGIKFIGPNGNSIFITAAGSYNNTKL